MTHAHHRMLLDVQAAQSVGVLEKVITLGPSTYGLPEIDIIIRMAVLDRMNGGYPMTGTPYNRYILAANL